MSICRTKQLTMQINGETQGALGLLCSLNLLRCHVVEVSQVHLWLDQAL